MLSNSEPDKQPKVQGYLIYECKWCGRGIVKTIFRWVHKETNKEGCLNVEEQRYYRAEPRYKINSINN